MLTAIIGNGLGIFVALFAMVIAKFRHHLPGRGSSEAAMTIAVVLMLFASELTRVTGLGSWLMTMFRDVTGWLGSSGQEIAAIITLVLLVMVAVHIFRRGASEAGMFMAFALPFGFALFSTGLFHSLDLALQQPAAAVAAKIASSLGV